MGTFNKIKWLASYPKSGNTWVRMFLNAYVSYTPVNINGAFQYARLDRDPAILQMLTPTPIKDLTHYEHFIYRPAMLLTMLKMQKIAPMFKTHFGRVAVDGTQMIPLHLSEKAIYIVRDPRDVVISLSKHMGLSLDSTIEFMNNVNQGIVDISTGAIDLILTWSQHVASWLFEKPDLPTLVVKYEDLLLDPMDQFANLLEFLELDQYPDYEDRLDFALYESSYSTLKQHEQTVGFIEKGKGESFFNFGSSGQWRDILTKDQARKIYEDHHLIMGALNYDENPF